jgi:hypothetical protein
VGTVVGIANGVVSLSIAFWVFRYIITGNEDPPFPDGKLAPFLLALAIFAMNIVYLVVFVKDVVGLGEVRYLTTRNADGGSARISIRALRHSIRRSVLEVDGVRAARIRIRRDADRTVRISATVHSSHEQNALELADRVRKSIGDHFFRLVPDDGETKVHVVVKIADFGTMTESPTVPTPAAGELTSAAEAFTGPRYPVDDDGED